MLKFGRSSEYWHPTTIMEIARGVGIPMQLDQATMDQAYRFYARVLVDIDLTSNQPSFLNVERDDHRGFSLDVIYENLLERCTKCKAFGHDSARCYQNNKDINFDSGRSRSRNPRQTYPPITKINITSHHNGQEVNRETTTNFEVDKSGFQEVDLIYEEQFPVMTNSFNTLEEDHDLIESFSSSSNSNS
ncbi:hypothetical protein Dsin_016002 [Dipteronia sinensis]|uniref:DUF4283 domain-containing protein n=1 Tax=Dipteronia sinensis TaxID=43782 RepID=A0AAE0E531_9ROSI|nr:hypothetical protein Dsin_016002 [Dipteronia sinensis]